MKTKTLTRLKAGFFTVFPFVAFAWILNWILRIINNFVGVFLGLFPYELISGYNLFLLEITTIIIFLIFLFLIGYLVTHYYIGDRVKQLFKSFANRIPLFSILFRVSDQLFSSMEKKQSFKKVVLVKFPNKWTYSVGFITSENLEIFNKATRMDLVSIFIPTTPNPTNGFLVLMAKCFVLEVDYPIALAVEFVVSMGTIGATNEILKSYLEKR